MSTIQTKRIKKIHECVTPTDHQQYDFENTRTESNDGDRGECVEGLTLGLKREGSSSIPPD